MPRLEAWAFISSRRRAPERMAASSAC